MALKYPPDKWADNTSPWGQGVWGTDMDESTTVVQKGRRSIHFPSSASFPILTYSDFIPVQGNRYYSGMATIRASSITAGNTVRANIRWFDAAQTFLFGTDIYNAVLGAANTWEEHQKIIQAPSTAAFALPFISKPTANAYDVYFDSFAFREAVPTWDAYRNTAQSMSNTVWDTIAFDNVTSENASFNTTTGVATITVPGWYNISARTTLNLTSAATFSAIRLKINGTNDRIGSYTHTHGSATVTGLVVSTVRYFVEGDTVEVATRHDDSASRPLATSDTETYFSGVRVE